MNREEFFIKFKEELAGLPEADLNERISFYDEIINDKIDEGKSEEEAISELGSIDEIVYQIAKDTSLLKLIANTAKQTKKFSPIIIILLCISFPLWFPLLLTGLILYFLFIGLTWLVTFLAGLIEVLFVAWGVDGLIYIIMPIIVEHKFEIVGLGMFLSGAGGAILSIFLVYYAFKFNLKLSKVLLLALKKAFIKRRGKNK